MKLHSALVTGANRGIGLQLIIELVKQNPKHIIATCRDPKNAKELNRLACKHSNIHIVQLEMTDYAGHDAFVAQVEKIVGDEGLTLLIQNAGIFLMDLKVETFINMYEVNSISPLLLTRKLMPVLRKSVAAGNRTIASFVTSLLGSIALNNMPFGIGYRMSKSALNQGVRTLAGEYKDEKIEFVLLHPGHVETTLGTHNGTIKAPVKVEESAQGMLKHLENEDLTKDGRMVSFDGSLLPW